MMNHHGPDDIYPPSRHAPVLRGKSADYLTERASEIFGGMHASAKTRYMHDQFCIGEQPDEGCYPIPDAGDIATIARWLSGPGPSPKKRTEQGRYLTATEAHAKLSELGDRALFIDVRTRAEVAFLGMPTAADANIPYMLTDGFTAWDERKLNFKLAPNSAFTRQVTESLQRKGLDKDAPVILVCRSGNRSAKAANLLHAAGYTEVYNITDGFEGDKARSGPRQGERVVNGWKNAGLPWSYALDKDKIWPEE